MLNDLGVCEIVFERGVCERLWVRLCLREVYVGKIVFERCVCAHHAPPPLCSSCKHGAALGPLPWVLLPGSSSPGSSALGPSPWLLQPQPDAGAGDSCLFGESNGEKTNK